MEFITRPVTKQELHKYCLKVDEEMEAQKGQGTCLGSAGWEGAQILTQVVQHWSPWT